MRQIRIAMVCLLLVAGCNVMLTEEQARSVCTDSNVSQADVDQAIQFAQGDRAKGLSAAESRNLFDGDCEDLCDGNNDCESDCRTCFGAVVSFVYSN